MHEQIINLVGLNQDLQHQLDGGDILDTLAALVPNKILNRHI